MENIKRISSWHELKLVKPLYIKYCLWGTREIPETCIYMGYNLQRGFFIRMECWEKNPLRHFYMPQDPVYLDSAMELFLEFPEESLTDSEKVGHLNFEVNANGALLATYGRNRTRRVFIKDSEYRYANPMAIKERYRWIVQLIVPNILLERLYPGILLNEGSVFKFNFYKISESKGFEHYGAYSPIDTETPNLHMPKYFEKAILVR